MTFDDFIAALEERAEAHTAHVQRLAAALEKHRGEDTPPELMAAYTTAFSRKADALAVLRMAQEVGR